MPKTEPFEAVLSMEAHKRFALPWGYGPSVLGFSRYGDESEWDGVYQRRHVNHEQVVYRLPYYWPPIRYAPGQVASRIKWAAGVAAYQALTAEQKKVYRNRKWGKGMSGYNIFMREWMLS